MPRYYCDYCDAYLTHDSASVRKQHNSGFKHKANVRAYYEVFENQFREHDARVLAEQYELQRRKAMMQGAAPMQQQYMVMHQQGVMVPPQEQGQGPERNPKPQ
ncbi:U1 small nuclear ribonucleoprotein C [Chloropicon primus]|uniref:U1 small nuclear ribonucleoprotein C n=1 Tax=Chloropicon primus TaxID=1764295 RepID=A0A5B8MRE7_9CHLO|nr:U1 small nuclear ribonucleoprotein C [Chloropicon primus]UPR01433.1 U1 small nuclear ribonucleoprotein C [Chloropicon primus]|mmetsp:Transcript_5316/g.16058  ORF Transcript_5316/g.16058 Transcript_5316/m.16058 type:complete len:103 (+) Transcript_5316:191-499(+)|eukprot:QDZ22215.1 U1 small nuclear ribonucleoprotein C [Chloropicon primus]